MYRFFSFCLIFFIYLIASSKRVESQIATSNQVSGDAICGGVLDDPEGYIAYKSEENYENNEKCIWIVRSTQATILFRVMNEGFEDIYDYLAVYTIDYSTGSLILSKKMFHGHSGLVEVNDSLAIIVFYSDSSVTGKGFILEYFGFGPRAINRNFKSLETEQNKLDGTLIFPSNSENNSQEIYSMNYNQLSLLINHPVNKNSDFTNKTMIDLHTGLSKLQSGCQFNYLSIFQLGSSGLELKLRKCESNDENALNFGLSTESPILILYLALNKPDNNLQVKWMTS